MSSSSRRPSANLVRPKRVLLVSSWAASWLVACSEPSPNESMDPLVDGAGTASTASSSSLATSGSTSSTAIVSASSGGPTLGSTGSTVPPGVSTSAPATAETATTNATSSPAGSNGGGASGTGSGSGGAGGSGGLGSADPNAGGAGGQEDDGAAAGSGGLGEGSAAGEPDAGMGGAGGPVDPMDPRAFAEGFDELFIHDECTAPYPPQPDTCLHELEHAQSFTFGGESGATYDVTLRVRGLFEPTTVTGGETPYPDHPNFKVGGMVSSLDYSHWHIEISEPAQTYWLNHHPQTSHTIYAQDFEVTLPVAAGAQVVVRVIDGNDRQIDNATEGLEDRRQLIEGVTEEVLDGQVLRLDVLDVVER